MTDYREEIVQQWLLRANESLKSAELELEAGFNTFAINRVYYAAFYAVTAALLKRKLSFKKHAGVRTAFNQEFIKKKLMDTKWGIFYNKLFDDRQEGDYIATISFDQNHVETQIKLCAKFLQEIGSIISTANENNN